MKKTHFISTQPLRTVLAVVSPIALLLSTAAVGSSTDDTAHATSKWDMIAFEVKVRGEPVYRWQYTPEYGGVWIAIERKIRAPQSEWTRSYRPLEADAARYAELESILEGLPSPAPDSADCTNLMPDAAMGTVRLSRGATTTEISWNSGCQDEVYGAFLALLRQADTLVRDWSSEVPVSRTEDHSTP